MGVVECTRDGTIPILESELESKLTPFSSLMESELNRQLIFQLESDLELDLTWNQNWNRRNNFMLELECNSSQWNQIGIEGVEVVPSLECTETHSQTNI